MRKVTIAIAAVLVAPLGATAWADPGRDESGHRNAELFDRYEIRREADRESWKRHLERRRESAKARREYEREAAKAWAEREREERKHYGEMRREERKHRKELRRERFALREEFRLDVGLGAIVYGNYPYEY